MRGYIQKFPDWPPGARTANGTALCHYVQLYRYFVNQSSEFCRHNPLRCFSTVCCCFRYWLQKFLDTPSYIIRPRKVEAASSETMVSYLITRCHNSEDRDVKQGCLYIYSSFWTSRDSSVGIALGYGLNDRGFTVRFPAEAWDFSLHHRVQNGSGANPASYPMGTRGSFSGGEAAGAWSWPLTSV
jgi:hypothetical protein